MPESSDPLPHPLPDPLFPPAIGAAASIVLATHARNLTYLHGHEPAIGMRVAQVARAIVEEIRRPTSEPPTPQYKPIGWLEAWRIGWDAWRGR